MRQFGKRAQGVEEASPAEGGDECDQGPQQRRESQGQEVSLFFLDIS
jgi:hypothetical protein